MLLHFDTQKFRDYLVEWIFQILNREAFLTRELKGALFVPYLINPKTTKHQSTSYL
ncbi:hypothetical protein D8674_038073 [Pyrus ussuriensis x Pyrus communis]|uniref:Uncharacterized protein n=1 Tax=Pyrus ussuriensis x Pyrus communis TaxID=2448454 RepID=A0A5N5I3U8_9ROSA|nr:hypothetical protein D8674_038073 [Pyrus ussuriensis x Pyrus communis]